MGVDQNDGLFGVCIIVYSLDCLGNQKGPIILINPQILKAVKLNPKALKLASTPQTPFNRGLMVL